MKKVANAYEKGRAAFWKGKGKFSDDSLFMAHLAVLKVEGSGGRAVREAKNAEIAEWKRGWKDAKVEADAPVEEAPKKKVAKKKSKKKVSKKKKESKK